VTTRHVSGSLDFYRQLEMGAPGDRYVLHAGVYGALDSYAHPIRGGVTWGTRTKIEARVRSGLRDRVVIRGDGEFCLRLAHETNANLEIVGLEVDASALAQNGPATGIKITNATGAGCAHHVRLTDVRVHDAYHQGMLLTSTHHVEIIGGSARNNGNDPTPSEANKAHGLYIGSGTWDCRVIDFDTSGNAAYGIHEYAGEAPGGCGRNLVRGGFHVGNGRLAMRAGVLLSGTDSHAERIVSTRNQFGVHVYHTARDCSFEGYLEGNRDGRFYVDPAAVGCVERLVA